MASFTEQFPDYPAADMPAIPAGFEDASWHNDTCPCFVSDIAGLEVWIDYLDPAKREYGPAYPRFSVSQQRNGVEHSGPSIQTDSWEEALAFIAEQTAQASEALPARPYFCEGSAAMMALEAMVDRVDVRNVLFALQAICSAKADHVQANWQDADQTKLWNRRARMIETLAGKV